MKVLFVHGWSCGPQMWQRMILRLRELMGDASIETTSADLGFFGDPDLPSGHFDLAVGHSLGFMWLLETNLVTCDRLVSINGFSRFSATDGFSCGWPHRTMERMRRQLGSDSQSVISNFMERSVAEGFVEEAGLCPQADIERLNWGLEALINGDGREQWSKFDGPRRTIAATNDQIVTAEMTHQCFPDGDIQWLKSPCHLLPLRFPEICAALIRELIEVS